MDRTFCISALFVLAALSVRDLLSDGSKVGGGVETEGGAKAPELQRTPMRRMNPSLKILYWAFEDYARMIQDHYPGLSVDGSTYPPPRPRALLAQVLSFIKFALIVSIIAGFDPASRLGLATPSVYCWALQNKMSAVLMLFFVGNMVENQLVSTGAFEVYLNDVPVWSKMDVGRLPQLHELFEIIDSSLSFNQSPH